LKINSLRKKKKRFLLVSSPSRSQRIIFLPPEEFFSRKHAQEKKVAHKWCNEEKSVEGLEVSVERAGDFHTLINTCVEILMQRKYFLPTSAFGLPCTVPCNFDPGEIRMVEYEFGFAQ
jgi:hypothetical protein